MGIKIGSLYIAIRGDSAKLSGDLSAAHKKIETAAVKMQQKIERMVRIGVAAGVTAVSAAVVVSIKQFTEWEVALNRLGNVSNRSLGVMREEILGLSSELGSVTELTRGYYQVLSAGITDADKSMQMLTTSAKMSKEAGIAQGDSVRGLVAVMGAYSDELTTASEAADLLYSIEKSGITSVGELIPLIGNLANLSKTVGLSANEMAAALAQITTTGAGTNIAATQLQGLLVALNRQFTDLPPEIQKYGSAIEAVKHMGFQNVLKEIMRYTEGNATALTKMLGRQEGYLGLLQLTKNEFGDYENRLKSMTEKAGSFDDAWKRYSETLAAMWETFKNTIGKQAVLLGEKLAPRIKEITEKMSIWVEQNEELIEQKTFEAIDKIAASLKAIIKIYDTIPSDLMIAGGAGLIGKMLFGPAAGITIASLTLMATSIQKIIDLYTYTPISASGMLPAPIKITVDNPNIIKDTANAVKNQTDALAEDMVYTMDNAWNMILGDYAYSTAKMVETSEADFGVIGDLAETKLTAVFQGEFKSIGSSFKAVLNNMYSSFATWASKLTTEQIVIPMAAAFSAGATGTAAAASGVAGLGGNGLLGAAGNFAGNMVGGAQLGLATFLGDSSIGMISDLGMAITSMNPLMFAGGMALGALGITKLVSSLFSGPTHTPYISTVPQLGRDASGQVAGMPLSNFAGVDYSGDYLQANLHGGGTAWAPEVDQAIAGLLASYIDPINAISAAMPDELSGAFDRIIDEAIAGFSFERHDNVSNLEDYIEHVLTDLTAELDATFGNEIIPLFQELATTLNSVTPAFNELFGVLSSATQNYFSPLLAIDAQLAAAGGLDFQFQDLTAQADTYKLLFDNAVANGLDSAYGLGQQYANTLVALDPYAANLDLASELATIREQMLEVAGSPEDFQASVLQTLKDFKTGVETSINSISEAITELHPEIKLDMNVDLNVEDTGEYNYQYSTVNRSVA